jgi:ATPase subunit of ABC transporter with duplicated ATPase domains
MLAGLEAPCAGGVTRAAGPVAWLGQHAALPQPEASLLDNLRATQPALREDALRERLAWFGFRADRVRQPAATLSRGERLRLALCCALCGDRLPPLLLLDEPDNHLDLDALATVEHALQQYPGGLVVVSHSRAFLEAIGIERWMELG